MMSEAVEFSSHCSRNGSNAAIVYQHGSMTTFTRNCGEAYPPEGEKKTKTEGAERDVRSIPNSVCLHREMDVDL